MFGAWLKVHFLCVTPRPPPPPPPPPSVNVHLPVNRYTSGSSQHALFCESIEKHILTSLLVVDIIACKWIENKSGVGTSYDPVTATKNKEECLSMCLWGSKRSPEINGVNFAPTIPPLCYCIHEAKFSTDKFGVKYCLMKHGFPIR